MLEQLSSLRMQGALRVEAVAQSATVKVCRSVNNICPYKVWSFARLKWSIVTRVHVPRQAAATTRRVLKLAGGDAHRLATDVPYSLELMVSKSFGALAAPVRLVLL